MLKLDRLYDGGIIILVVIFLCTVVGGQAHKYSKKAHHTGKEEYRGHNAPVEQSCEWVVEILSGESRDFTPESPDPDGHGNN